MIQPVNEKGKTIMGENREYSVIVGNVGTALTTESYSDALREYVPEGNE